MKHAFLTLVFLFGFSAMVGAGSVVTKSIPSGEVWVGNPAKFLRKI